ELLLAQNELGLARAGGRGDLEKRTQRIDENIQQGLFIIHQQNRRLRGVGDIISGSGTWHSVWPASALNAVWQTDLLMLPCIRRFPGNPSKSKERPFNLFTRNARPGLRPQVYGT